MCGQIMTYVISSNHLKEVKNENIQKNCHCPIKLFEKGDEDGFVTRYYNDEDVNENGGISTSGIYGEHEIQVPYVSTLENQEHLSHGFGRDYLCVGIKGERWLVEKEIFESTYEEVTGSEETLFTEEQVIQIVEKSRATGLTAEFIILSLKGGKQ